MISTRTRSVFGAAGLCVLLAACGGGDSADASDVASVSNDDDSTSTTVEGGSATSEEELLDYYDCLRDQGIDIEDPTVDAEGNIQFGPGGGGGGGGFGGGGGEDGAAFDREAFTEAQEVCGELPEGVFGGFEGGDFTEFEDTFLEYSECMRDQGIDVPDPDFSGGFQPGGGEGGEGGEGGGPFGDLDTDDPAVAAAQEICQEVFADSGFGGAGGAGGAGGSDESDE